MRLRAVIASLLLAVFCVHANAGTVAYAEAFDTLYAFDLSNRSATPIGRAGNWGGTPITNVVGLTVAPTGQLFAVSDTQLKVLMTVDRATGAASVIGPFNGNTGLGTSVLDLGLSFTCDGRLWLSSAANGALWQVDPASAALTPVGNLGVKITGLTARGNKLYGAGSQGTPSLYRIDVGNAQATAIGSYGSGINPITTTSPGFDPGGQLWAVLDDVPPLPPQDTPPQWSSLGAINATGAMTILGDISTPSGLKYPSNATQLPYIGLKGLAIASPCAIAPLPVADSAPTLSTAGALALLLALVGLAGTSPQLRRRSSARF